MIQELFPLLVKEVLGHIEAYALDNITYTVKLTVYRGRIDAALIVSLFVKTVMCFRARLDVLRTEHDGMRPFVIRFCQICIDIKNIVLS